MKTYNIELPAEFRSGNGVSVERATIMRGRMEEILINAIEHDRKSRDRDMQLCEEALEVEIQHSKRLQAELDRKSRGEPVASDDFRACAVADSNYAAGMLLGWNLCVDGDEDTFSRVRADRMRAAAQASREAKEGCSATQPAEQRGEPVAKVVTSVPHLRSIVVQAIPEAEIPPQDALLYAAPQPAEPVHDEFEKQQEQIEKSRRMGARLTDHRFRLDEPKTAEPVKGPSEELQGLGDRAYSQYIEQMSRPECKGVEYKLENDKFGVFELAAHNKASEYLGRHRAFSEAVALLDRYGSAAQPAEKPVDPELIAAVQEAAKARSPFAIAEDGAAVLINYGDEENRMVEHEENACPHCGGSGHKEDVQTAAISEPLVRYCPGCGSIGTVEGKYRDCCPDGNEARLIPQALAEKCRDTFQVAIRGMLAEQESNDAAPIAAQPREGWKLVPIKPTREMIAQGYDKLMSWDARTGNDIGIWDMYAAMLEAAPTPPAGDQEVRTHE